MEDIKQKEAFIKACMLSEDMPIKEAIKKIFPEYANYNDEQIKNLLLEYIKYNIIESKNTVQNNQKKIILYNEDKSKFISLGQKVKIHCKDFREKEIKEVYDGKIGVVTAMWELKRNPNSNVGIEFDNNINLLFDIEEIEPITE